MEVGAKYEDLCFTCQHPLDSIYQRRDTNQPSTQNDLYSSHQQPVIYYMSHSILEGPEICPTKNKQIPQIQVCLSCLQDCSQNHHLRANRGPPTQDPTQTMESLHSREFTSLLRLYLLFVSYLASRTNSWLTGGFSAQLSFKVTPDFLVCNPKLGRSTYKSSLDDFFFHQLVVMNSIWPQVSAKVLLQTCGLGFLFSQLACELWPCLCSSPDVSLPSHVGWLLGLPDLLTWGTDETQTHKHGLLVRHSICIGINFTFTFNYFYFFIKQLYHATSCFCLCTKAKVKQKTYFLKGAGSQKPKEIKILILPHV